MRTLLSLAKGLNASESPSHNLHNQSGGLRRFRPPNSSFANGYHYRLQYASMHRNSRNFVRNPSIIVRCPCISAGKYAGARCIAAEQIPCATCYNYDKRV